MQKLIGEPPGRIPPVDELINLFEFEDMAQRKLDSTIFAAIAGSERAAFDRITLRPRLMVDSTKLDMSVDLFGQKMFSPILIGPASQQKRFHPQGELAMVRGASAGKAAMVVCANSSVPIEEVAAESKTILWFQTYAEPNSDRRIQQALKAGCKAVCVTIPNPTTSAVDWNAIGQLRHSVKAAFLIKGIMSPEEARKAMDLGADGIVVSSYSEPAVSGVAPGIAMLPAIADAIGGKIPILVDGGFRRGSDIIKALALGAKAVMLGRPPLWGLSAYGADGVQKVAELLQTELARNMAGCGRINLQSIDGNVVRLHRR